MAELIVFLLVIGLIIGVIYLLVAVALPCFLIGAMIVGPPLLAGAWLRRSLKRYGLSNAKVWQCVAIGLAFLALPFLMPLLDDLMGSAMCWDAGSLAKGAVVDLWPWGPNGAFAPKGPSSARPPGPIASARQRMYTGRSTPTSPSSTSYARGTILRGRSTSMSPWTLGALIWAALGLGLGAPAVFLTVAGYRQVIWPHRRAALAECRTTHRLRRAVWARDRRLNGLEESVRREDQRHGALRLELEQVRALTHEVILRTDPAFFSAEVARWRHTYAAMPSESLKQYTAVLQTGAVAKNLERALERLPETSRNEPGQVRQLLHAATAHTETIARVLGGRNDSYDADVQEIERLQTEIKALESGLVAAQDNKSKAVQMIRQLRKERVTIQ